MSLKSLPPTRHSIRIQWLSLSPTRCQERKRRQSWSGATSLDLLPPARRHCLSDANEDKDDDDDYNKDAAG